MTTQERINKIREAIEMIEEAKRLVDDAIKGTSQEDNFDAYSGYGFDQLLGRKSRCDDSLYSLIRELRAND